MLAIDSGFGEHILGETISIAALLEIVCVDGTTFNFTDLDRDLIYNGITYYSAYGFDASAVQLAIGVTGETVEYNILLSTNPLLGITRQQLSTHVLNYAKVTHKLCNWSDVTQLPLAIFTGYIIEAKYGDNILLTLSCATPLSQDINLCADKYGQLCRWDFGDANCGVDISSTIDGPRVYAQVDPQTILLTSDENSPEGYYNNGLIYFVSGSAKGNSYEIITSTYVDNRMQVTIKVAIPFTLAQLDSVLLYAGCDKMIDSGCTYWKNTKRFGGEPFVPQQDIVTSSDSSALPNQTVTTVVPYGTSVLPTNASTEGSTSVITQPMFPSFPPNGVDSENT